MLLLLLLFVYNITRFRSIENQRIKTIKIFFIQFAQFSLNSTFFESGVQLLPPRLVGRNSSEIRIQRGLPHSTAVYIDDVLLYLFIVAVVIVIVGNV